jgi:hypothetical protein
MAIGDRHGKKTEVDFIVWRNRPVTMFVPLDMKIYFDLQSRASSKRATLPLWPRVSRIFSVRLNSAKTAASRSWISMVSKAQ